LSRVALLLRSRLTKQRPVGLSRADTPDRKGPIRVGGRLVTSASSVAIGLTSFSPGRSLLTVTGGPPAGDRAAASWPPAYTGGPGCRLRLGGSLSSSSASLPPGTAYLQAALWSRCSWRRPGGLDHGDLVVNNLLTS
jgi:hypothetical protein